MPSDAGTPRERTLVNLEAETLTDSRRDPTPSPTETQLLAMVA